MGDKWWVNDDNIEGVKQLRRNAFWVVKVVKDKPIIVAPFLVILHQKLDKVISHYKSTYIKYFRRLSQFIGNTEV